AVLIGASSLAAAGPIEDMQPGTWYEVPNSKLSALDPCPARNCAYSDVQGQSAVMDVWNGGAFATRYGTKGGLIVWGGGHTAYSGNEVYIFDVGTLQWKRLSEPTTNTTCDLTEGEFPDGTPCTAHTSDGVQYHPGTNSFVILGAYGLGQTIYSSQRTHLFSLDTMKWRRGAVYTGKGQGMYGTSAYDPKRDVFYMYPGYNAPIGMYDPDANSGGGAWSLYNAYNADAGTMAAIDPTRDIMVWVDAYSHKQVVAFDLNNMNSPVVVKLAGDTTPMGQSGYGFDWDSSQNVFVSWTSGTSVYTLTPPAGDWRTGTWTWQKVAPSGSNTVTPTAPNGNHTYSRWRYVPAVNAWILANRTSDNVFFYKLSAGASAKTPEKPGNVVVK
ncbi:MAG TPA: hypothetical protein VKB34_04515, partial [Povalibacter sp.]|nr:hypothetical protein [Povalibacter sp.]